MHRHITSVLFAFSTQVLLTAQAAEALPDVQRFHQYTPMLASSGQPKRAQFQAIAAAGYKVVINLVAPEQNPEAVRDEKQAVEAAGMEYHYFPLGWDKPDAKRVVEVLRLLDTLKEKPVLVHCWVNSRASLVAYLYRSTSGQVEDADEKAVMTKIWKQNRGYEFENSGQWQLLVEDAKVLLKK